MQAHSQDEKSLRKDIYKLRRELRSDLKEVRGASKLSSLIPTEALSHMTKVEREMRDISVRKMGTRDLLSTYRQLKYIRGLKSSTIEGAEKSAKLWTPIKEHLDAFSKDTRDEWWNAYGEIYKNWSTMDKFKYTIFEYVDKAFTGDNAEEIKAKLVTEIDKILEAARGELPQDEVDLRISNKLQELLQELE